MPPIANTTYIALLKIFIFKNLDQNWKLPINWHKQTII